jgi:predicted PurR-regulated permease PerM
LNIIKSGWELKILAVLAILYTIKFCQPILFPILFSFFLYLLLNPIVDMMGRIKIPKIVASTLIIIMLLALISSIVSFLVQPASSWIERAPENFHTIENKFSFIKKSLGKINKAAETAQEITEDNKVKVKVVTENKNYGPSLFDLTTNLLILIFSILILLFFLLIYFKNFIQNLEIILHIRRRKSAKESEVLIHLKNEVSKYLFTFTIICAGLGCCIGIVFWLLGLPNALLWGVMAMLLTFIPYLGHLMGIIVILFVSLLTFDTYFYIVMPPLIYFLFTVLEGQIITPIFLGNRLNLNPLVVFTSIFVWNWMWGISGILISVPFLVTIKIVLEHIPELRRYKLLLES